MFNAEYYVGTIKYLKSELEKIPGYRMGTHSGRNVVRSNCMIGGKRVIREYDVDSSDGRKIISLIKRREKIENRITDLDRKMKDSCGKNYIDLIAHTRFDHQYRHSLDRSFWESIREDQNTYPKNNNYFHRDIHMRSRAEVRIAEALDRLGLTYKYEVRIKAGKTDYDVDFVIWLPQFNCCILIEYFGSVHTPERLRESADKFITYTRADIMSCQDIIYLCGTENNMPTTAMIEEMIAGVINGISRQHVFINNR